jgi:hypothetical protein
MICLTDVDFFSSQRLSIIKLSHEACQSFRRSLFQVLQVLSPARS